MLPPFTTKRTCSRGPNKPTDWDAAVIWNALNNWSSIFCQWIWYPGLFSKSKPISQYQSLQLSWLVIDCIWLFGFWETRKFRAEGHHKGVREVVTWVCDPAIHAVVHDPPGAMTTFSAETVVSSPHSEGMNSFTLFASIAALIKALFCGLDWVLVGTLTDSSWDPCPGSLALTRTVWSPQITRSRSDLETSRIAPSKSKSKEALVIHCSILYSSSGFWEMKLISANCRRVLRGLAKSTIHEATRLYFGLHFALILMTTPVHWISRAFC